MVKKLEARFHPPFARSDGYIVVAHLILDAGEPNLRPRIEPAASLARHGAPATVLATLRHLVVMTAPRSFERLESLRSQYWSFVPVGIETSKAQDG